MQVLSFSLYGNNPLYIEGALRNAYSFAKWYPNWLCWFYVGSSVPRDVCEQLKRAGAHVSYVEEPETPRATLWRFRPASIDGIQTLIVRDCDSQFSKREQDAVWEWLDGGKPFHIMRDHPAHRIPILAGMCGVTGSGISVIRDALTQPLPQDIYGTDQIFLAKYVYPQIKKDACIHDAYFCYELHSRRFPSPREGYGFVGEVLGPQGEISEAQRVEIKLAETSLSFRLRLKAGSIKDLLFKRGYWRIAR